jgi:class 3 adenylate cyclase
VTQEDDAACRAAGLELVAAVTELGSDVDAELAARAGSRRGDGRHAGAEGQGLVGRPREHRRARPNGRTPGTVFVTDVTRRASDAAIVYEDAGMHQLKGKAEPMRSRARCA